MSTTESVSQFPETDVPAGDNDTLSVDIIDTGASARLVVTGEVDCTTAATLRAAVTRALEKTPVIVLDMAGVTFLDSAGLSVLIMSYKHATAAGGSLRVERPSAQTRRILEITGQAERFIGIRRLQHDIEE